MTLLAAEPVNFRNRHSLDTDIRQSVLDCLQLEMPDDRFAFLHHNLIVRVRKSSSIIV